MLWSTHKVACLRLVEPVRLGPGGSPVMVACDSLSQTLGQRGPGFSHSIGGQEGVTLQIPESCLLVVEVVHICALWAQSI